ncbi:MAG: zinc ABC transporter substrate-binding protein [candidate division WOR-3 bacterium]|nr:zinc ABC transporter substrate-binding protein [candidate division WOR-3 bacterium]MCX7947819.1 zinc ABC transporter substrate-binding protein [candidate division WOR-3 bacterium]MDW8150776.1 zinc ABC transporter substrate-binding protein [candidate division WOR-3 bacterium]
MPKKIFWLIFLNSCINPYEGILYHHPKNCEFRVLTTITILYDLAKEIGGNRVCVESLVPVGGDPHKYEPIPSDIVRISKADIILANGHNLENWLLKLLSNKREDAVYYEVAGNIEPVNDDPHLWMDVNYAKLYAKNIKELFSKIDREGARTYEINYERYIRNLDELNNFIVCVVSKISKEDRKLVTTHDAFSYFARRYGFEFVGSIWGISTEDEPSIREIKNLIDLIKKTNTKALFIETTVNPKIMESISKETGVRMGGKLYGDSIGKEGSNAENYIKMQIYNIITIYEGITKNRYKGECDGELKNIKSYSIL